MFSKEVSTFLTEYSTDTNKIDRLLVSAFLYSNNIKHVNNKEVKKLLITEQDGDYNAFGAFYKLQKINTIEELIEFFEFVISPTDKVVTGAVYTPESIRDYIINQVLALLPISKDTKICDPACGCAGFLYSTAKWIKRNSEFSYLEIYSNNIYGLDIQKYSTIRSKLLLTLWAIIEGEDATNFSFNIYCGNALGYQWEDSTLRFSGIVGNPPYVASRNIDDKSKEFLKNWSVCSTGHPDLYIPFFELGLQWLSNGGILGYITMNTFFKSINGRSLRAFLANGDYKIKITDFGGIQIFKSKSTYTCICVIEKISSDILKYKKLKSISELGLDQIKYESIKFDLLDNLDGWNLQEIEILSKIETAGVPLSSKFKSRNGIATLKNSIYVFDPIREDDSHFYLKSDIIYPIEKNICKEIINPNKLTKVDSIDQLKRKIIFPYHYINDQVELLNEDYFKSTYPNAYQYLNAKKDDLAKRDKGNGKYERWYAYGRNQSLEKFRYKLFFPHISSSTPNFVINLDENLLFCNGLAIIGKSYKELEFLNKLLSSRLFWFYISKSSRHYGSDFFSLSKNYFKKFGIFDFTETEINYIINETNMKALDKFIEGRYDVDLSQDHLRHL